MVLDHSVPRSSGNAYSRTQTVRGGGCVYERAKTCGHDVELDNAVDMSASSSPCQATEKENVQRSSKVIRGIQQRGVLSVGSEGTISNHS